MSKPTQIPSPSRYSLLLVSIAAIALGAISTLIARGLIALISLVTNLSFFQRLSMANVSPAQNRLGWLVIAIPPLGGIVIGLMARYGSKAIRGHGIPEAMEQVLQNRSRIAPIVMILKPVSAAISIGTGGPFGAEGPIIATGGALGSVIGQIFCTTALERKTLLAVGAAAGMTAIFGTPVAAVLLAIELLLFEFHARSLAPVALGCASAAAVRIWFFGHHPAFEMTAVHPTTPEALLAFALVGGAVGAVATAVSRSVYWIEEQFERLPVHWMWWPALGGVAVGVIGFCVPRTLGVGYDNIEDILSNRLPMDVIAALCLAKFVSWAISLGSGTSGGTLAPLLTLGGGLGALFAALLQRVFPGAGIEIGMGALVGMAAMFSGASRALLASVLFAYESTLQPNAIPALLGGATVAYLVSQALMRHTIMTEKIARRGVGVPHGYETDALQHTTVAQAMSANLQTVPATATVAELFMRIRQHDPAVTRRRSSLVVTPEGELAGIITRGDLVKAIEEGCESATVLEIATTKVAVAYPDETVHAALAKMMHHGVGRLPVVERSNPRRIVGYLGREEILNARASSAGDESLREPGWVSVFRKQAQTHAAPF